ncbi:Hypothetical predicted protein, partial [Paramuricea clavata]
IKFSYFQKKIYYGVKNCAKLNIIIVDVIIFIKYNTFYFIYPPRKHDFSHILPSSFLFIAESGKYHPVVVFVGAIYLGGGWSFSCKILYLDKFFLPMTTSKTNPSEHYKHFRKAIAFLFRKFWHICHVDCHGHFTLKQLRLPVLNETHTNSCTGPRLDGRGPLLKPRENIFSVRTSQPVDNIYVFKAKDGTFQKITNELQDNFHFVSLRDVERAMKVIVWFYSNSELIDQVIGDEDNVRDEDNDSSEESSEEESSENEKLNNVVQVEQPLSQIVRAVILGIGVCYFARLNERQAYCKYICRYFDHSCPLPGGALRMQNEIRRCQRGFLKDMKLAENIARNTALSENVFMMAICTELRIPLFVVGKPGSSKSLAKDVISTNMKAGNSQSELFKNLKQIHMQSYQCSPLSTPEGIVSTFRQCAKLQKDKDLNKFVSVVVLDEIGLAEDSPLMPLKTLHPLLEDGTATTVETGTTSDYHRVGFIGLSNWSLDPAKMNRGIMLSRGVPSENELCDSARGICSGNKDSGLDDIIIWGLCKGYFDVYDQQSKSKTLKNAQKDEFFGLRDFYSLVKMVYGFAVQAERQGDQLKETELEKSIRRNFSGLDDLDPMKIFCQQLQFQKLKRYVKYPSPECHPVNLIQESLGRTEDEGESRYLLVLTENYAALRLLQGKFHNHDPVVIFGSSFPKDQQYTQICRNINRIKVCMETGRMVILLNLESLYESLYDALNQHRRPDERTRKVVCRRHIHENKANVYKGHSLTQSADRVLYHTKSRVLFTIITEPEVNNCFSFGRHFENRLGDYRVIITSTAPNQRGEFSIITYGRREGGGRRGKLPRAP